MLAENTSWKEHTETVKINFRKTVVYYPKPNNDVIMSLEKVYISLILIPIWTMLASLGQISTNPTKLENINCLQKQAAQIILNKDWLNHS